MRYQSAAAFRAAIDARLKMHGREHGEASLTRVRRHIAFDRLLARIARIGVDQWVLKGGLALDYRLGERARSTRDIDLFHPRDEVRVAEVFERIANEDGGDFFQFTFRRTAALDKLIDAVAIRYQVSVFLDGRLFERFVVDIGFDETPTRPTDMVRRAGFLAFAELGDVVFPALAIEFHLAEKLHAYAKIYPPGRANTRIKDLIDMVLIGETMELIAGDCAEAIRTTFTSRDLQPLPGRLLPPPEDWRHTYSLLAASVGIDPDLDAGYVYAASLFDPLLAGGISLTARWSHHERAWV